MATDNTKRKIGLMPCEGQRCKSHERNIPMVVFENQHGTLSYSCDWCQRAPYAKKGTEQYKDWMADIGLFDSEAPPGAPPQPAASGAPVASSAEEATDTPPAPPAAKQVVKKGMSWLP